MQKLEKEIKVLDINVDELEKKLELIGAKLKAKALQKIYVYDLPTIYFRILEITELLKSDNELIIETNMKKLKLVFDELIDFLSEQDLKEIMNQYNLPLEYSLYDVLKIELNDLIFILSDRFFLEKIKKYQINPNKYIRLRETNGNSELTVKHILTKPQNQIQKVIETEIQVNSFEETNQLLNSIGIVRRSYQEKIRSNYTYKNADISIDQWPYLNPYIEIECDDSKLMKELLKLLQLEDKEIVSLNTEELYRRINMDVHNLSELKFQEK